MTIPELRRSLENAYEEIDLLGKENERLQKENAILAAAVDQLGREKIEEYINQTLSTYEGERALILAERGGILTANIVVGVCTLGVFSLINLLTDVTMTGPRSKELSETMGTVRANLVALWILRRHYESDFTKISDIASRLFPIHFRFPRDFLENGAQCSYKIPSIDYKDLDTLMAFTEGEDLRLEEFQDVPKSHYDSRDEKSRSRIKKAEEALRFHHEKILEILRMPSQMEVNPIFST